MRRSCVLFVRKSCAVCEELLYCILSECIALFVCNIVNALVCVFPQSPPSTTTNGYTCSFN